jgi:prefoldin subunit 1
MAVAANNNLHPQVDLELKRAFEDLQVKMINTRNQMKVIGAQSETLKRQTHHSKLTEAELRQLPENVPMYEGIGRMFALSTKDKIISGLETKVKSNETRVAGLDKNKEYLEKSLKDSENSLRELISVKQGKK